jgi:hypothetical protein
MDIMEPQYDENGRRIVFFPTRLRLVGGRADKTGEVAGIFFHHGVSRRLVDFRQAKHIGTILKARCAYTGVELTNVSYKNTWVAAAGSTDWHPSTRGPLPAGAAEREAFLAEVERDNDTLETPPEAPGEPSQENSTQTAADNVSSSGEAPSPTEQDTEPKADSALYQKLVEVLANKGAKFVRQLCEARGIEHPGRSGAEMIEALIASGIALSTLKDL